MKANVGGIDRALRLIIGAALIIWGVLSVNYWGAIGLVLVGTALFRRCPAYVPLGISSAEKSE